jgi:hypothetical protein
MSHPPSWLALPGTIGGPVLAVFAAAWAWAGDALGACTIESPAHRATVLELYTSEGCNSCPPADRWLSRLREQGPEKKVLPLAFHVDYWNDLGWVDRFSQPVFSARQRQVAGRHRSGVIYTPQMVLDGQDWRGWRSDDLSARLRSINGERPGATIRGGALISGPSVEVHGTAQLADRKQAGAVAAWLALYEQGLVTAVAAGENRGRTLQHDYVVRALIGPLRAGADGSIALDGSIPLNAEWKRERLGIAAFAEHNVTGRVLQAASAAGCL